MQLTWRQFRSTLAEYFTIAVYAYSGEFELRELAASTVYANETDIEI